MSSPLNGPEPTYPGKSIGPPSRSGSVAAMNSSMLENVEPTPSMSAGRKKTPWRKMLNELKKFHSSKLPPNVKLCRPRNSVKLLVSWRMSVSRMLWIEKGSWPAVV